VPVIERLTTDHRRIDPLLAQGDRAFSLLPATRAAAALVAELSALLARNAGHPPARRPGRLRGALPARVG
jgi:hypothetical protein